MSEFAVFYRKKVTINTDPQRRYYDGCNFSEKTVWSEWKHIVDLRSREEAEGWVRSSLISNPKRQYKVEERE